MSVEDLQLSYQTCLKGVLMLKSKKYAPALGADSSEKMKKRYSEKVKPSVNPPPVRIAIVPLLLFGIFPLYFNVLR